MEAPWQTCSLPTSALDATKCIIAHVEIMTVTTKCQLTSHKPRVVYVGYIVYRLLSTSWDSFLSCCIVLVRGKGGDVGRAPLALSVGSWQQFTIMYPYFVHTPTPNVHANRQFTSGSPLQDLHRFLSMHFRGAFSSDFFDRLSHLYIK